MFPVAPAVIESQSWTVSVLVLAGAGGRHWSRGRPWLETADRDRVLLTNPTHSLASPQSDEAGLAPVRAPAQHTASQLSQSWRT